MGDVYAGRDEKLDRKVALKVLHAEHRLDAEARERLLREARSLSKVDSPHLCRIHDYIESTDVDLLVLEYIDGQTLQNVVAERQLSRGEKLRIAVAIAQVLVAAHRAGIIHRDLKPENVMLTKSGDVKVLDFGLARWLNVHSSGRRLRAVSAAESGGIGIAPRSRTQAGTTVGTPLYMSPEQARGVELTTASDLYSFGLLLQFLFTGADPYPPGLTAQEVMLRAARGDRVSPQNTPRDIAALLARLGQFAPADRPTAVETLAQLQLLGERPRRFARQTAIALAALVVLLASWRYTTDLARERTAAIAARAEAEQRRAQAEDLFEFMLGDLRQKLEPVGKLDILNAVAEKALAYSSSLRPDEITPDGLVRNAKALHQLAQVRIAQGDLDGAMFAADRAALLTGAAAQRDASSPDVQFGVATSHFWVANVRRLRGELPQALTHAEAYRDITDRLALAYPANHEYQVERDYGRAAVATILERQGNFRRAAELYELSVGERRARLAANPTGASEQAELALALNKIGLARQRLGELTAARKNFEEEFTLYSRLTAADPKQKKWRERLINSYSYLSALVDSMGEDDRALELKRAELVLGRELHAYDPANADWHRNLAIAEMRLGDLLRRRGDAAQALQSISEAEALLGELVSGKDARKSFRKDLAIIRAAKARALLARGRAAQALEVARRADEELSALAFKDPLSRRHQAEAALTLGEALQASGDLAAARTQWNRAEEILAPLVQSSSDPLLLDIWSRTLLQAGRPDEARDALQRLDGFGYHDKDLDLLRQRRRS
jgi:serine/threonine-protein kinase